MMRSRRHRPKSVGQWLGRNPFLAVAIIAGLLFAALAHQIGNPDWIGPAWRTLGFGFHVMAHFLERILPDLHGGLEIALVVVLGLIPYLVLDAIWRWLKPD